MISSCCLGLALAVLLARCLQSCVQTENQVQHFLDLWQRSVLFAGFSDLARTYSAWALTAYSFVGGGVFLKHQHEISAEINDAHVILSVTLHAALC